MREHDIRHLPVVEERELCGMISDRDVHLFEAIFHCDPHEVHVEEAMSEPPIAVDAETPIDEVVELMGERKLGSVVVKGKAGIRGIFTATDACRALAQILRRERG